MADSAQVARQGLLRLVDDEGDGLFRSSVQRTQCVGQRGSFDAADLLGIDLEGA
ncbi:hypothetical protein LP420_38270 [Massilia sp. B-10]|nr:hypothetical protein LP420_38270 [Massilia sp. B-10]UUZ54113.1 hypothetical protein LP419_37715 [Massilia sp. H-1]